MNGSKHSRAPLVVMAMALLSAAVYSLEAAVSTWSVGSPNSELQLSVTLKTGRLEYQVGHKGERVLNPSPLGLRLNEADLSRGLKFESSDAVRAIREQYTVSHGKRKECRNEGNELVLHFRGERGWQFELDLRAYDNGVAFRYRIVSGSTAKETVLSEETGFGLPENATFWCAPSDKASTYSPAYETYYENGVPAGTASPSGFGWSFPMLFNSGKHWVLITEANVDPAYCGSRLSSKAEHGMYKMTFPLAAEGNGTGAVNPSSTIPWVMPWRVIEVGDTLGAMVESTLVTDLATSTKVQDTSWIKPGRVAWSWWSDQPSPKDAAKQNAFVDFASEMGWEYVLVDANWTIMDNGNIHDVIRYAKEKNVGVLLWYNSGGPHNVVTEKPRDSLTYEPVRKFELDMLKQWGVKGVKVDFFQSDKQEVIGLYHAIARDAAEWQIMVNFHGCTLPRGWERTYPNLMSMEAVRGEECYIFDEQYPQKAPIQNCILPFTRNAVGPMDYTPVGFSNNNHAHKTTWAHELALTVVFESGWLHFADGVAAYRSLPTEPKDFLKNVPVTWDDTKFIDGYPGKFVVVARKHGSEWYLAGINGENTARDLNINTGAWLNSGAYKLTTIADGSSPREFSSNTATLEAGKPFSVKLLPYGGFVATIKP